MKTALLIIDIQNDYFPGGKMELVGSIEAAAATARLLAVFRKEGWPVFHVRHLSIQPGATFLRPETPGCEIYSGVAPLDGEPVITKNFPNSFRDTDLEQRLRAEGVGTLLCCGMMSHMCVDTTVRAAFDLGFSCIVTHDACATRDLAFNGTVAPAAQVQAAYMAALGAVFARVLGVDEIMENTAATA